MTLNLPGVSPSTCFPFPSVALPVLPPEVATLSLLGKLTRLEVPASPVPSYLFFSSMETPCTPYREISAKTRFHSFKPRFIKEQGLDFYPMSLYLSLPFYGIFLRIWIIRLRAGHLGILGGVPRPFVEKMFSGPSIGLFFFRDSLPKHPVRI